MSTVAEDVTQILWGKRFPHGGRDEYVLIDANMAHAVAEHLADALAKAGYGKLADAWDEGHESGFWNGRESSGNTEMVPHIGIEHAREHNPYRSAS